MPVIDKRPESLSPDAADRALWEDLADTASAALHDNPRGCDHCLSDMRRLWDGLSPETRRAQSAVFHGIMLKLPA